MAVNPEPVNSDLSQATKEPYSDACQNRRRRRTACATR
jgi:hypothetical protein